MTEPAGASADVETLLANERAAGRGSPTECSANTPQTCTARGVCSGVCVPGSTRCSGNGVQTCSVSGHWGTAVACSGATPKCSAGVCVTTPSCQTSGPGLTDCGPKKESCCTSPLVKGGTFYRSYGGVSSGFKSKAYPATVSDFRLDKYEIMRGRQAWRRGPHAEQVGELALDAAVALGPDRGTLYADMVLASLEHGGGGHPRGCRRHSIPPEATAGASYLHRETNCRSRRRGVRSLPRRHPCRIM